MNIVDRMIKYLKRYLAKPGRHRRNSFNEVIDRHPKFLDRQDRLAYPALHRWVKAASAYKKAGATHLGGWYDTPTGTLPIIAYIRMHDDTVIQGVW